MSVKLSWSHYCELFGNSEQLLLMAKEYTLLFCLEFSDLGSSFSGFQPRQRGLCEASTKAQVSGMRILHVDTSASLS